MSFDIFQNDAQEVPDIHLPEILVCQADRYFWLNQDGEIIERNLKQSQTYIEQNRKVALINKHQYKEKFKSQPQNAYMDLLELFAFIYPAQFVTPLTLGFAKFFQLPAPIQPEDELICLHQSLQIMINQLQQLDAGERLHLSNIAEFMGKGGWNWSELVMHWLGIGRSNLSDYSQSLKIWQQLPDWEDSPPIEPPLNIPLTEKEVQLQLKQLLGSDAEHRQEQTQYALSCMQAMQPVQEEEHPHIIFAEAGTGTGKTLGYIAAASIWSKKNQGSIWLSTYTKNLQRQLHQELQNLDQDQYKIVVRKGRENYFCLYNYDNILTAELNKQRSNMAAIHSNAIGLGLIARWLTHTKDGDMVGGDFPAWLIPLLGNATTKDLSDQRGECIYSACPHYKKCFIEHVSRQSRQADIVVSNHALTLYRAARGAFDDQMILPTRYVFDEGHHLFDAVDQVFSAHFTARETVELRRWILGKESRARQSSKGLRARLEDLISQDKDAMDALLSLEKAARKLPEYDWHTRLKLGQPKGLIEQFLSFVRAQVYARNMQQSFYGLETSCFPLIDGFEEGIPKVAGVLREIIQTCSLIMQQLKELLDKQADTLDSQARTRIEAICISLNWRAIHPCSAWLSMINDLSQNKEQPDGKISWFAIDKIDDMEFDCGMHQHFLDPTEFLAKYIFMSASGTLITSATLKQQSTHQEKPSEAWEKTIKKNGGHWLEHPPQYYSFRSPFDYAKQAKLIVVTDVNKNDSRQVSSAFRTLFMASGGGALGLFTAISRLRRVYDDIALDLQQKGIRLYAQHVSHMDTGTLMDMFREDINACMLGTDATRDGVDVPGESLRLLVLDRVPWPRPTILHKARRNLFEGRDYDESIVIANLRQAWGRLIRKKQDKGVFVILDNAMPSRFQKAFPEDVNIIRAGLMDSIQIIQDQA